MVCMDGWTYRSRVDGCGCLFFVLGRVVRVIDDRRLVAAGRKAQVAHKVLSEVLLVEWVVVLLC
jgi:hypothetical protein